MHGVLLTQEYLTFSNNFRIMSISTETPESDVSSSGSDTTMLSSSVAGSSDVTSSSHEPSTTAWESSLVSAISEHVKTV